MVDPVFLLAAIVATAASSFGAILSLSFESILHTPNVVLKITKARIGITKSCTRRGIRRIIYELGKNAAVPLKLLWRTTPRLPAKEGKVPSTSMAVI